jgi:anhydro-N-acetylmuramic acid kinase
MTSTRRDTDSSIVVGLMSGTSLDGITAAVARFTDHGPRTEAELLAFLTRPYSEAQRKRLAAAMEHGTARDYTRLDFDLGGWLADAASAVIAEAGVARADVAAIASHGQTLWHEPGHSTWQIGQAAVIAERCGVSVVSDFRVRDVAAGGQGAPLVPIADALLFADESRWRALQNIGGIGNVTIVPPYSSSDPLHRAVRAFDTGPGVVLIDGVVRKLFGIPFDEAGAIAARGAAVEEAVAQILREPYFEMAPPKSTGRELFDSAYVEALVTRCRRVKTDVSDQDIVATATALTARSIILAFERFVPEPVVDLLVSGGGAKNGTLLRLLRSSISQHCEVRTFDELFFDGEAKEAVSFALLAYLHLKGRPGNVPTATGARGGRILGTFTPADGPSLGNR